MKLLQENKIIISDLLNLFGRKGFKFENSNIECGIYFIHKSDFVKFNIGISYRNQDNDYKNINGVYIRYSTFNCHIAFPEIEKILHPILSKNKLFGMSITTDEIYSSFSVPDRPHMFVGGKEDGVIIRSEEEIMPIIDLFKKFYHEEALPFFEHWHSLTVLYDYIKDLPEDDLWDILGQFAPMKKAIILRLCNDSNYQGYMDNYHNRRKGIYEQYPNEKVAKQYYNASKELKEVLAKTEPVYNIY